MIPQLTTGEYKFWQDLYNLKEREEPKDFDFTPEDIIFDYDGRPNDRKIHPLDIKILRNKFKSNYGIEIGDSIDKELTYEENRNMIFENYKEDPSSFEHDYNAYKKIEKKNKSKRVKQDFFTTKQIFDIFSKQKKEVLSIYLHKLTKKKLLIRVKKGLYFVPKVSIKIEKLTEPKLKKYKKSKKIKIKKSKHEFKDLTSF